MNGHLVLVLLHTVWLNFFFIYFAHFQINLLSSSHDARAQKMSNVVIYWLTIVFFFSPKRSTTPVGFFFRSRMEKCVRNYFYWIFFLSTHSVRFVTISVPLYKFHFVFKAFTRACWSIIMCTVRFEKCFILLNPFGHLFG